MPFEFLLNLATLILHLFVHNSGVYDDAHIELVDLSTASPLKSNILLKRINIITRILLKVVYSSLFTRFSFDSAALFSQELYRKHLFFYSFCVIIFLKRIKKRLQTFGIIYLR